MIPLAVSVAGEDEYLKQIQSEALKIEDFGPEGSEAGGVSTTADIKTFEQELERQYRGSYLFYKKLTRRGQEEIYLGYQKGASIEDIREKIMNRFLHNK